jgi:hypothetical protein
MCFFSVKEYHLAALVENLAKNYATLTCLEKYVIRSLKGVNVMNTIFGIFCQSSATKCFLETQRYVYLTADSGQYA